jgi:UDP-3-O-[3-hydroxymyristoyl] glucosamine N-acyltransferase
MESSLQLAIEEEDEDGLIGKNKATMASTLIQEDKTTLVDETAEAAIEEEVQIGEKTAPLLASASIEEKALVDLPITIKTALTSETMEAAIKEEGLIGEKLGITLVDEMAEAAIEEEVHIGEKEAPLASSLIEEKALADPLITLKTTLNEETAEVMIDEEGLIGEKKAITLVDKTVEASIEEEVQLGRKKHLWYHLRLRRRLLLLIPS